MKVVTLAMGLIVLSGLDIVTTHLGLVNGAREGNPIAVHIIQNWGEPFLYLFKLSVITAVCLLGTWRRLWWTFLAVDLLMVLVVLSNIGHL